MKVLHIDIETSPHEGYFWGLGNRYIGPESIKTEGRVLSFAAKWDGDPKRKVYFVEDFGGESSAALAEAAGNLIDEADVVVHYNGTNFDMPRLRVLLAIEGCSPPSPATDIDLLKTVRSQFSFPSNRLSYVAPALGCGEKLETGGFDLWKDVLEGDEKAWAKMKRYNIQDVLVQERLYHKLRPWIKGHPNPALHGEEMDRPTCPTCGGTHIQWRGYAVKLTQKYRRFQCQECGTYSRERFTAVTADQRRNILTGA